MNTIIETMDEKADSLDHTIDSDNNTINELYVDVQWISWRGSMNNSYSHRWGWTLLKE